MMRARTLWTRSASALLLLIASGLVSGLPADDVLYVRGGSTWRYLPGLAEASSPDAAAWRQVGFDDSAWASGPAPFGFGEAGLGTDLSLLDPRMQGSYTCIFLRQTFQVADLSILSSLEINVSYDDGLIAWINGREVLRANMLGETGDPVSIEDSARLNREPRGQFENFRLDDPDSYIAQGENVLAVQMFNQSVSSADLWFDLELVDPLGPDLQPPEVSTVLPAPGVTLASLTQIEVFFTEDVAGVDAGDLLVGGSPAGSVSGEGRGPYVFRCAQPSLGAVAVRWSDDHGIVDLAPAANRFAGGSWSYTLDPDAPLPDVAISELVADGDVGGPRDEDGEYPDWIEIHNRGAAAVSLLGWALSDDRGAGEPWSFPDIVLEPGAYLVVFASGKDRRPADGTNLHTDFKLATGGEYLGLFSPEV
ncbi:MAG: lamin tail domain-containing protein, partial [Planctomycetes bacterium]|nr:lamin tail domain-containing protein [Planctomycetota bacterium]